MKWKFGLPQPPMLVYYYAKLIGLAPFTVIKNRFHPPTLLGRLYTVSLAVGSVILPSVASGVILKNLRATEMAPIAAAAMTFQYWVGATSIFRIMIIFLSMHKKVSYTMNGLWEIGKDLKILGIEEDHGKFFKRLWLTTVGTNAIGIAFFVLLYSRLDARNISYSIVISITSWYRLNTIFVFVQTMLFFKKRFAMINEELYDIFDPAGHRRRSLNRSQMFVVCGDPRDEIRPGVENLTDLRRTRKIESLHLKLCDLVHETTHVFAIPLSFECFQSCFELMLHCFWIYMTSRDLPEHSSSAEIVKFAIKILYIFLKIGMMTVKLLAIAYASVKTCEAGNATKAVLFKVWYKFKPWDLEDEFHMFSLQLMQKPVIVSIFGYFDLDYSYVYKIFCAVMAYVIVMIQFDKS